MRDDRVKTTAGRSSDPCLGREPEFSRMGRRLMKATVPWAQKWEEGPPRRNVRQHEGTPASPLGGLGALELLSGARTWQDLDIKRAMLSLHSV